MAQLTINDAILRLAELRQRHGGALPLWLLYTVERRGRLGWRPEPVLVPVEGLELSESVPGAPAVFVVGLGATLGEDTAHEAPRLGTCARCGQGTDLMGGHLSEAECQRYARPTAQERRLTLDLDPDVLAAEEAS